MSDPELKSGWPTLDALLDEVRQERVRQDGKHGGESHDDKNSPHDWERKIARYNGWAAEMFDQGSPDKYRRRMINIAAMALAAVESHDRKLSDQ